MRLCEKCGACFDDDYDFCGFDGGKLMQLFAGARVIGGRYLLEQRVAQGAMGIVVRATHLQVGSTVAVKLMRPMNDDTHVALARFQREAQILGQIKHPNAVLVIDFGVEQRGHDSAPYLVMEYLRGESLSSLLDKKKRLSLEELERILVPLCEAVEEAHAVGVIHRDIKPGNVVLERLRDGSQIVKVLDFGIAKFVARGPGKRGAADGRGPARDDDAGFGASPKTSSSTPAPVDLSSDDEIDELAELLADDDDDFLAEVVHTRDEAAAATAAAAAATISPIAPTVTERPTPSPRTPRPVTTEGAAVLGGGGSGGSGGAGAGLRDPTTEAGFMIGTIPYMAPEQMTGERVSVRTDVHAVAVLAFQCLAGRLPYDGDDEDIIAAKLSDERPLLSEAGIGVPDEVEAVFQRAFALDPAQRPATVRELADAIRHAAQAAAAQKTAVNAQGGDVDDVVAQLAAVGRSLTGIEGAARSWLEASTGESYYAKARDVLLAIDAPLKRVKAALSSVELPLSPEHKAALADAHRFLEGQVRTVRRSLARMDPQAPPVPGALGGAAAEYGDYLAALWTRLDATAQEILETLSVLAGDDKADTGPFMPVQLFAEQHEPRAVSLSELADRLLARDPLDAVEALEELLEHNVDQVVRGLSGGDAGDGGGGGGGGDLRSKIARALWRHADTLLLHELTPTKRGFRLLPFLAAMRDLPAAAPFALLARVLGNANPDDDSVNLALAALERAEDRAVLARCLLVHPSATARNRGVAVLDLGDLWNVIAHTSTPIATLDFLFQHVRERAPDEYVKIFFFCVRENLRAAATPADVAAALSLVSKFFQASCFHEDLVFDPLLELDRTLRARSSSVDPGYAEALAAFTAGGVHESRPLDNMRDIPLPIQRKLAREGRFLTYFVSHSNDRVARETLPHLFRLDDITPFLRIITIHRIVLTELAKRKRFFRKEPPKLALLLNPKTPAVIARVFLPLVPEEQLRIMSTNKHINADVRRLINATLARERQ